MCCAVRGSAAQHALPALPANHAPPVQQSCKPTTRQSSTHGSARHARAPSPTPHRAGMMSAQLVVHMYTNSNNNTVPQFGGGWVPPGVTCPPLPHTTTCITWCLNCPMAPAAVMHAPGASNITGHCSHCCCCCSTMPPAAASAGVPPPLGPACRCAYGLQEMNDCGTTRYMVHCACLLHTPSGHHTHCSYMTSWVRRGDHTPTGPTAVAACTCLKTARPPQSPPPPAPSDATPPHNHSPPEPGLAGSQAGGEAGRESVPAKRFKGAAWVAWAARPSAACA